MAELKKTYLYKVYDGTDFLGVWNDVISDFKYSQEINSAGSSVEVELARNSDTLVIANDVRITEAGDVRITEEGNGRTVNTLSNVSIGPGSNVDLNLNVEVWIFYGADTQDARITEAGDLRITEDGSQRGLEGGTFNASGGRRIFKGYISKYVSRYGTQETTLVNLFSNGAELDQYVIEDTGDTTVPYLSMDPSDILKDILDKYVAAGGVVSYDALSIEDTGDTVSYTFNTNTTLEGINTAVHLAPTDWFWYLDMGEDIVYFKAKPSSPAHTFLLGKHIISLDLERYIEELVNVVYFSGGETSPGVNLFKKYTDAPSIAAYRRGLARISDNRVTLDTTADVIAGSAIDRAKDPRYRSSVTISDLAYDIETIRLGDLVEFRNFGNFVDLLMMQIVKIDYTPDAVTLQLDTLLPNIPKRVEDVKRNLDKEQTVYNPPAPS